MARPRRDEDIPPVPKRPPATTSQGRENQLIGLAVDLAEKKLMNGTATSQEIVHFLKMATVREELERDKLKNENVLLKARVEMLQSGANTEKLYREAIDAFTSYSPENTPDEFID